MGNGTARHVTVTGITVRYLASGRRWRRRKITLADMRDYALPERVHELLDDLTVMCADIEAHRRPERRTGAHRSGQ